MMMIKMIMLDDDGRCWMMMDHDEDEWCMLKIMIMMDNDDDGLW